MVRDEPEFFSKFLKNYNYKPFKCRVCGERFWSIVDRDTCSDRPCSRYDFLLKKYPSVKKLSLDETRNKFINFFKKHGHGYVEPYPVLARWRNDLYLTIASIIVFQPAVTEGISNPPYNPLVIVQPCIRLEDIDEVGYTFGRHFSSFEMGGHHAFNKDEERIYWVDETLEYAYRFFTEDIGIPSEDIVFKDSWWEGGGNAGPAYEVVVDGLELATLVFMKYRIVNGKYVPMNVLVVDTGYGIERIAWFTQKTPTAFHTVYGRLVDDYKNLLSIDEPPHDVLKQMIYMLSDKDVSPNSLYKILDGYGYSEYYKSLLNSINLYTLLDHSKALALMLSDGIVPSNTGEGYLARLVLRRMLRTLHRLGVYPNKYTDTVLELMDKTISYWTGRYVYDKFRMYRDYIVDVIVNEVNKYIKALDRGLKIVEKTLKRKRRLSVDDFIEIYDSHGVPPEIVVDKAGEYGIELDVPKDFYSLVAKRHSQPTKLEKYREEQLPIDAIEWALGFPSTRKLFHEDPYMSYFKARVIGVKEKYLILDQTAFYPKAGGQDCDLGYIVLPNGRRFRVRCVYKCSEVVVHELIENVEGIIKPGMLIEGYVDWIRRYCLMRHHTATHIVLGAARKVLGDHVWQAGVEKTIDKARLDITHYKPLSRKEVKAIEDLANKVVNERRELKFYYLEKFDAEKKYGIRIYQGGAVVSPKLRIVEIPGWDAEACFGTHLHNTGEVGGIKIIGVDRIQDGVIRLEFIAGSRIRDYAVELEGLVEAVSKSIGVSSRQLVSGVKRFKEELSQYRSLVSRYRSEYRRLLLSSIESVSEEVCGVKVVYLYNSLGDEKLYRNIVLELVSKGYVVLYDNGRIMELATSRDTVSKGADLLEVLSKLEKVYPSIRGGGKKDHVTFSANVESREIYSVVKKLLMEMIGCVEN